MVVAEFRDRCGTEEAHVTGVVRCAGRITKLANRALKVQPRVLSHAYTPTLVPRDTTLAVAGWATYRRAVDHAPTRPSGGPEAAETLARALDGYLITQLLRVVARLGVADVLAAGPLSGPETAAAVGADASRLAGCCAASSRKGSSPKTKKGALCSPQLASCCAAACRDPYAIWWSFGQSSTTERPSGCSKASRAVGRRSRGSTARPFSTTCSATRSTARCSRRRWPVGRPTRRNRS